MEYLEKRIWSKKEIEIHLLLIRHGETASNKERRYLGKTEESLSEEGVQALIKNKKMGKYPQADIVFSSPMKRCMETAAILYPDKKLIYIMEWREMDFGIFEGKNYMELRKNSKYQAWIDSGGTLPFPEGESRETFILRCEHGIGKMVQELEKIEEISGEKQKTVAIIVHGGTIMALLSRFYGGEYFDYQVSNGQGYLCKLKKEGENLRIQNWERLG